MAATLHMYSSFSYQGVDLASGQEGRAGGAQQGMGRSHWDLENCGYGAVVLDDGDGR